MGEDPGQVGAQRVGGEETKSPEQLRAEIEADRQELGDTVEALAAKTDVKTRAREKADELKRSAMDKKDELVSKAKQSKGEDGSPGGPAAGGPGGSSVVEQLKGTARQNPVQTAAVGAFLGGFMLGRLLGRR
jgi:ElaB/YqjD/DUF883 family membrane-anchored ribosome-binding protein